MIGETFFHVVNDQSKQSGPRISHVFCPNLLNVWLNSLEEMRQDDLKKDHMETM